MKNPPTFNEPIAGQWVRMRWRLYDPSGAQITDPATVAKLESIPRACPGQTKPVGAAETYTNTTTRNNNAFEFVWKTKSQWRNTCRNFILTLNDGTVHSAHFKFKSGTVTLLNQYY